MAWVLVPARAESKLAALAGLWPCIYYTSSSFRFKPTARARQTVSFICLVFTASFDFARPRSCRWAGSSVRARSEGSTCLISGASDPREGRYHARVWACQTETAPEHARLDKNLKKIPTRAESPSDACGMGCSCKAARRCLDSESNFTRW